MLQHYEYDDRYRNMPKRSSLFNEINSDISKMLKCIICTEVFIEPTQIECGCRFCYQCINDYIDNNNNDNSSICPNCGCNISKNIFLRDHFIENEIFQLQIKCLNDFCDHICEFRDLSEHLNSCDFRLEQCETCYDILFYKSKDEHMKEFCRKIIMECNECDEKMTKEDLDMKNENIKIGMDELCKSLKGECPYNCGNVEIENIKVHLQECCRRPIHCPFNDFGCNFIVTQEEIAKHLDLNSVHHQQVMMAEIIRLRNLNDHLNKSFLTVNETMMNNTKILQQMNKDLINNVQSLKVQKKDSLQNNDNIIPLNEEFPKQFHYDMINDDNFLDIIDGECIWTINSFKEKYFSSISGGETQFISDSFYTNEPGYKMCLKICPNGDGQAINNYLSIYFIIIPGEYDDELLWPFQYVVAISIVSNTIAIPDIITLMKPEFHGSCCNRPRDNMNVGAGQEKFIKLSKLLNDKNYLHDGSIKIKLKTYSNI